MKKRIKPTFKSLTLGEKIGVIAIEFITIFTIFILPFIICGLLYNVLGV